MRWQVREMTAEEAEAIGKLARSRTAPARAVMRARILWRAREGRAVAQIAAELGVARRTVRLWLRRFSEQGLAGLADAPRAGRPRTYTPAQVGEVVGLALSDPDELDLPFGCWTLDRLAAYLGEVKGIPIKRSRIGELLRAEGLRWRTRETWFGERVDPAFAEKRGPSSSSTPPRLPLRRSSASTSWARRRPRASPGGGRSA
jgi:transposase